MPAEPAEPVPIAQYQRLVDTVLRPGRRPAMSEAERRLFGRAVRSLRNARGLRPGDLARRAGIPVGALSMLERATAPAGDAMSDAVAAALDFRGRRDLLRRVYGRDLPLLPPT